MMHRRAFVLAGGASLALGIPRVSIAQARSVVRRSVRGLSAEDPDLAAMSRAVARMKSLPQSDPRNWIRFADIHRNFCPHGNWYFLPWHRAYLLSFERVVRELSGKADFALPYWNWTADRQFPAAFLAGDRNSNPLFHPRPNAATLRLQDDMVGGQVMSRILNSPDFEAFGSTRPRGQDSADAQWQRRVGSKTELEFNPHDGVHQAIGGNMSQVSLSARDPIFFLHHANIDRLWSAWNARGHANTSEAMWRDFSFSRNFVNPDGSPFNVSVNELNATPALGYRYDDANDPFAAEPVNPGSKLLSEKLDTYRQIEALGLLGGSAGVRWVEMQGGGTVFVATADNDQVAADGRPIGVSVGLGRPLLDVVGSQGFAALPNKPRRYVWAFLRDLEAPLDVTTRVRVFCNCRDLTSQAVLADPSYATSVSFFGEQHGGHDAGVVAPGGGTVCIDLTPSLSRLDARSLRADRLTVQLLPHCRDKEANVSNIRPRQIDVVIL